ncbi:hypothetical protein BC937DRAFT_95424 [Endogone sp. FLAS-F59071]|nr:hypothetical protein BC937DRAFT_95424 [Endogone sp. FLAS-F59071]|eukprot:RUS13373.1 hypothetical protein BC937DRAFT_95424 [Endogone sp. FLAS-F59071]
MLPLTLRRVPTACFSPFHLYITSHNLRRLHTLPSEPSPPIATAASTPPASQKSKIIGAKRIPSLNSEATLDILKGGFPLKDSPQAFSVKIRSWPQGETIVGMYTKTI